MSYPSILGAVKPAISITKKESYAIKNIRVTAPKGQEKLWTPISVDGKIRYVRNDELQRLLASRPAAPAEKPVTSEKKELIARSKAHLLPGFTTVMPTTDIKNSVPSGWTYKDGWMSKAGGTGIEHFWYIYPLPGVRNIYEASSTPPQITAPKNFKWVVYGGKYVLRDYRDSLPEYKPKIAVTTQVITRPPSSAEIVQKETKEATQNKLKEELRKAGVILLPGVLAWGMQKLGVKVAQGKDVETAASEVASEMKPVEEIPTEPIYITYLKRYGLWVAVGVAGIIVVSSMSKRKPTT